MGHDAVRGHIVVYAASSLYKRPFADMAFLMHYDAGGQDRIVVYVAVAGYFHSVAQYAVVADMGVVADVALGHYI